MSTFGFPIITSQYLTVPGEPVEVPAPDWRERMERNGRRAMAHNYRGIVKKWEPYEPLDVWVTPQVPDPNVYVMPSDGLPTYVCHPETAWRLQKTLESAARSMRSEIDRMTSDALIYGRTL